MNIFEISQYASIKALHSKLLPDEESTFRYICRKYSTTFFTPLDLVEQMDPEKVLLALHESSLDKRQLDNDEDFEIIVQSINQINDPNYDAEKEKAEQEWNEQIAKTRSKINSKQDKKDNQKEATLPNKLPASGGVNFDWLANRDSEG